MAKTSQSWGRRVSVILMILTSLAIAVGGLYVLLVPVDEAYFSAATGVEWTTFSAEEPEIAAYVESDARLLGITWVATGLLSLGFVLTAMRRRGDRSSNWLWVEVAVLLLAAGVFVSSDAVGLAAYYAALGVIAGGALLAAGAFDRMRGPEMAG